MYKKTSRQQNNFARNEQNARGVNKIKYNNLLYMHIVHSIQR